MMVTIRVDAQLSPGQLLAAVEQLSAEELETFLAQVVTLWARRQGKLSAEDKRLLDKINEPLPEALRKRYDDLSARRDAETLTPPQHKELMRLTEQIEARQAERVQAMAQLARRRNTTLARLVDELGLTATADE